ncbi:MAG: A/G-specific adenine glycosylase [Alphaproteobacteria bacterium]
MGQVSKGHDNARARGGKAAGALLTWYGRNARDLPWRGKLDETPDPYRVWLSEIMLQQTTVAAVIPYYRAFLERWPDVATLARASLDDVLGAWSGLGYYNRARNLHRAAQIVARDYGGEIPQTPAELKTLPGIGEYTSAAIAAIAFGEPVAALDANGERVISRLFAVREPLPKARKKLRARAQQMVPKSRPGDFTQAMMDLGSSVCTVKNPSCAACPLSKYCAAFAFGNADRLPRKVARPIRPMKRGAAFVALDGHGAVYLERRPENGLLGTMLQPPSSEWRKRFPRPVRAPFMGKWRRQPGVVRHGFTHFELEMEVYVARFKFRPNGEGRWYAPEELSSAALPTIMRKVIAHALYGHINSERTR